MLTPLLIYDLTAGSEELYKLVSNPLVLGGLVALAIALIAVIESSLKKRPSTS